MQAGNIRDLLGTEIRELNRQFLTLATDNPDPLGKAALNLDLSRETSIGLAALGVSEKERLANCPYALFDIAIPVSERPQPVFSVADCAISEMAAAGPGAMFKLLALMCQRALVRFDAAAAQLTFGLLKTQIRELDRMSLYTIVRLAMTAPDLLRFRFAEHPTFWSELVHLAAHGSDRQLAAAHLAGQQWIAAGIAGHQRYRQCQH